MADHYPPRPGEFGPAEHHVHTTEQIAKLNRVMQEAAYAKTWQAQIDAFADACRELGRAILKALHLR